MAPHWPNIATMLEPPATWTSMVAIDCAPPSGNSRWIRLRTVMKTR